jgi:hypothetical protein
MGTNLPDNFADGQELEASELNKMLVARSNTMNPIDDTTRNETDLAGALGSPTYRYTEGYINDIYSEKITSKTLLNTGNSSTSFSSTANFTIEGELYYENFTLNTGHVMSVGSPTGTPFAILRVNETLTIAGNITGYALGASGGTGGAVGGNGVNGAMLGGSGGGAKSGAGSGGGISFGYLGGTLVASTGFATGKKLGDTGYPSWVALYDKYNSIGFGAGGGGGEGSQRGGNGGSGLLVICKNLVITGTPTFNFNGENGFADTYESGGGGGGVFKMFYNTLTGTVPTPTVAGGLKGAVNSFDGGAGYYLIEQA